MTDRFAESIRQRHPHSVDSPPELRNALDRPMDPIAAACHGSLILLFQRKLGAIEDDPAYAASVAQGFCHDIDATVAWMRGSTSARRFVMTVLTDHPLVGAEMFDHHYGSFKKILEHVAPDEQTALEMLGVARTKALDPHRRGARQSNPDRSMLEGDNRSTPRRQGDWDIRELL